MPEEKFSLIIKRNMFYSKYLLYSTYFIVKPITWSKQLLWQCTRVMAFFLISLFLEWFWHEVRISDKSHKSVSKTYWLENLSLWWRFVLLVHLLILWMRSMKSFQFHSKKVLTINWSVKTLWHSSSMGTACYGLWAIKPQWLSLNFSTDNTDWRRVLSLCN